MHALCETDSAWGVPRLVSLFDKLKNKTIMPKKIIAFHDEETGGVFYVEVEEREGVRKISNEGDSREKKGKFSKVLESLKIFGKGVRETVKDLGPNEVEVKAGMKLELGKNGLIAVLVPAKSDFSFEVTLIWKGLKEAEEKTKRPEQT